MSRPSTRPTTVMLPVGLSGLFIAIMAVTGIRMLYSCSNAVPCGDETTVFPDFGSDQAVKPHEVPMNLSGLSGGAVGLFQS